MKRIIPLLLVFSLLLAGCSILNFGQAQPTPSDADMATQVALVLTNQPSPTSPADVPTQQIEALPTVALPTPTINIPATATVQPKPTDGGGAPTPTALSISPTPLVQPTDTPTPLPTPTFPTNDPRQTLGNPTFTDKLDNSDYWPTGEDTYTAVTFRDGKMLLTALTETDGWRLITYGPTANFYAEITARFEACSGTDHFGFYARVPEKNPATRGYLIGINCLGQFRFAEWDGTTDPGTWTTHVYWTANPAILAGPNQTNRIGLLAENKHLTLYVNGVKVGEMTDESYQSGYMGLFVGSDETQNLTVQVDEFNFWAR